MGGPTTLQLKSEDGVLFKVEKYYLQANSGMFRDMLALPTPTSSPSTPLPSTSSTSSSLPLPTSMPVIVDIPAHSTVFKFAIKMMELGDLLPPREAADQFPGRRGDGKLAEFYMSLVRLLDFLDCAPPTRTRGLAVFETIFDTAMPWCIFTIGAKPGNLVEAKRGISRIGLLAWGEQCRFVPESLSLDDGEVIPLPWLLGYFSAFSQAARTGKHPQEMSSGTEAAFWIVVSNNLTGPVGRRK